MQLNIIIFTCSLFPIRAFPIHFRILQTTVIITECLNYPRSPTNSISVHDSLGRDTDKATQEPYLHEETRWNRTKMNSLFVFIVQSDVMS